MYRIDRIKNRGNLNYFFDAGGSGSVWNADGKQLSDDGSVVCFGSGRDNDSWIVYLVLLGNKTGWYNCTSGSRVLCGQLLESKGKEMGR